MSVALPWVLLITAAAIAGVIVAHLLAVGDPPTLALPTARFVSEGQPLAASRARTPQDRLLLLLRVLALALAGAAFAGVRCAESRAPVARLLVLDGATSDSSAAWRASVDAAFADARPLSGVIWRDGPSVIRAAPLSASARDSLRRGLFEEEAAPSASRVESPGGGAAANGRSSRLEWNREGTLAGALLRARRGARVAVRGADRLQLEVVTRARVDATSDGLSAIRSTWPGPIVLRTADMSRDAERTLGERARVAPIAHASALANDVVVVALQQRQSQLLARDAASAFVAPLIRVTEVGDSPPNGAPVALSPDDSLVLRQGGALVWWPSADAPQRVSARTSPDGAAASQDVEHGVVARGVALIAPLRRYPREARASTEATLSVARPLAWYLGGTVAIDETPMLAGCLRAVHFAPPAGDLLLDPSARGVLDALMAPCGHETPHEARAPLSTALLAPTTSPDDTTAAVSRDAIVAPSRTVGAPWVTRALLAAAMGLLLVEQWWRSSTRRAVAGGRA